MSSVSSILPMFGVSSVVFHGSGLPYIGMPVTTGCAARPTGGKIITSYLRSGASFAILRADVGERNPEPIERHTPPAFVLRADPGVHEPIARGLAVCVFTDGAAASGDGLQPRSAPPPSRRPSLALSR